VKRAPLSPLLAFLGRLISRGAREELASQVVYPGSNLTGEAFRGLKVLAAPLGALALPIALAEFGQLPPLFLALIGAGLGWVLPDLWVRAQLGRRHRAMVRFLPEVIDLLALCVGAGMDFVGALNKVVVAKARSKEPLIEELSVALQEIKLGKRKLEAFKGMAKRIDLPEVSSFVRTLVQADRMGTPVAEVLSIHSEDVRLQRFTRAERAAMKAPIKILVPLIFFIMPCVAIIVAAPIMLQFTRQNPFSQLAK
jgi:tight adherence protein C